MYKVVWWGMGNSSQQINVSAHVAVWYAIAALVLEDEEEGTLHDILSQMPDAPAIRISAASLVRMKAGDYYLVSLNRGGLQKGVVTLSPIGGAYHFASREALEWYQNKGIPLSIADPAKGLENSP